MNPQEGLDLKEHFSNGVARQAEQHKVGIGNHLGRLAGDTVKPSRELLSVRRADSQLLLPLGWATGQQADHAVLAGSKKPCYHMA
jgi:hypothetical protein